MEGLQGWAGRARKKMSDRFDGVGVAAPGRGQSPATVE